MDQKKVGHFLKELRSEKDITQEQLAELLGISNRSISRWENGATMPDFDLLIQVAKYYEVEIGEILEGERRSEHMDQRQEETLLKVADYSNMEKLFVSRRLCAIFITGLAAFTVYMALDILGLSETGIYGVIADFMLGLVLGVLLVGILYSSRTIVKIKAAKMRLLHHLSGLKS